MTKSQQKTLLVEQKVVKNTETLGVPMSYKELTIYLDSKGHFVGSRTPVPDAIPHTNFQWTETLSYVRMASRGSGRAMRVYWWSNQLQHEFSMMMRDFHPFLANMELCKAVVVDKEREMDVAFAISGTWGFKLIGGQVTLKRIK